LSGTAALCPERGRRRARTARPNGGFTLIEVLVALAIVVVGMAAVLGALTSSADTVLYLRDKTFAQWVALNQIATLRLSGQLQQPGTSDGDTDFAERKWHWRQEVTSTEIPGVVRIDVKVRPAEVKADEDNGWFTTVSGVQGDAVGTPNGYLPDWGSQSLAGITPTLPGGQGNPLGLGARGTIGSSGALGAPTAPGAPGTLGAPQPPGNIGGQGLIMPPQPPQPPQPITPDESQ
jgi:general secretion pathway protein I